MCKKLLHILAVTFSKYKKDSNSKKKIELSKLFQSDTRYIPCIDSYLCIHVSLPGALHLCSALSVFLNQFC